MPIKFIWSNSSVKVIAFLIKKKFLNFKLKKKKNCHIDLSTVANWALKTLSTVINNSL